MRARTASEVVCAEERSSLTVRDRQRHHRVRFEVPQGAVQLEIAFSYRPGAVGQLRNLLTLTLSDPHGFRGAAHRWQPDQEIVLDQADATPGFFPGPLYPGAWECSIDAHEIVSEQCEVELSVRAQMATGSDGTPRRDPRSVPPGPAELGGAPGWYRGDLHSHSLHCDGHSSVGEMAAAAAQRGLEFLAMTSHNTTSWLGSEERWPDTLLPLRGIELTTFFGHATVLGSSELIDWRIPGHGYGIRRLQKEVEARDAVFVVAHPFAVGNPYCTGCRWEHIGVDFALLDCLEVWNGRWGAWEADNPAALDLWSDLLDEGFRVTAVAGSDNHRAEDYRDFEMPVTWVYADGLGETSVLEAHRHGHVVLSTGPRLQVAIATTDGHQELLPGSVVRDEQWNQLVVGVSDLATSAGLWLVSDGGVTGRWEVEPPGAELELVASRPRRWSRLELRRGQEPDSDLLTVTNPLYADEGGSA